MIKILVAAAPVYTGNVYIENNSATVEGVLKRVALVGFPILLLLIGFLEPKEAEKARETAKAIPRYLIQRLHK